MELIKRYENNGDTILKSNKEVRDLYMLGIYAEIADLVDYVSQETESIRRNKKLSRDQKAAEMLALEARATEVYTYLIQEAQVYAKYYPADKEKYNIRFDTAAGTNHVYYRNIIYMLYGYYDSVRDIIDCELCDMIHRARNIDNDVRVLAQDIKNYSLDSQYRWADDDGSIDDQLTQMLDTLDQSSAISRWLIDRHHYMMSNPFPQDDDDDEVA